MSAEDLAESTLLKRRKFMAKYGFSDSAERRGRAAGGRSWPPHLVIGPAKRVYYLQESVEKWLREQQRTGQEGGADDD
jgi:predicted DNA-binding transcriptional regulator AlpA